MAAKATGRGAPFRIIAVAVVLAAAAFFESAALPRSTPAPAAVRTSVSDIGPAGTVSNLTTAISSNLVLTAANPYRAAIQNATFPFSYLGAATHQTRRWAPGTVTVLSSAPHPSLFGRRMTVTATVAASRRPTGPRPVSPLDGAVTFYLCARPSRLVPGSAISACKTLVTLDPALPVNSRGQARLAILGLPAGPHPIFARFRPANPAAYAVSVSPSITRVVTFSRPCVTTTISGRYRVPRGRSICIRRPGRVTGGVTVDPGGALSLSGAVIAGPVTATRARGLRICRATITGRVSVRAARGFVEIGAGGPLPCGSNIIGSRLSLRRNHRSFEVIGNRIRFAAAFWRNIGRGPFWLHATAQIRGNRIGGALSCRQNHPAPASRGARNLAARRSGQCAARQR